MGKVYGKALTATSKVTASVEGKVERALNGIRLAVLGILVGIGLAVGFGVEGDWWIRVVAGIGSVALACAVIGNRRTRNAAMTLMHRLTGA
jgi:uncharacterized membrane protein YedE/YeeE